MTDESAAGAWSWDRRVEAPAVLRVGRAVRAINAATAEPAAGSPQTEGAELPVMSRTPWRDAPGDRLHVAGRPCRTRYPQQVPGGDSALRLVFRDASERKRCGEKAIGARLWQAVSDQRSDTGEIGV